ncbi:hypothetical protein F5Y14DRAFT_397755 [Nemania sp. NC0429]|nr:hypothetical protein F5Y14DRAFT_397755 [Nemania sp. NC0429]
MNHMSYSPRPMPMMNHNQPGYHYGYGYVDWPGWEDNYPVVVSNKQWREHTKTAREIGEFKDAVTSEIKGTRLAVEEAHLAIQKTHDAINAKHAEQMKKQEQCAADAAKARQFLEAEAKKHEKERQMQEMIQLAQSQGLMPTPAQAQAQAQALAQIGLDRGRGRRGPPSRSSSPATSASSGRRIYIDEQREADKLRRLDHKLNRHGQELEVERNRRYLIEDEVELLRRKDAYFHKSRLRDAYYDEAPPYNDDVDGVGGIAARRSRRGPLRCWA